MGVVVSVNVGLPQDVPWQGRMVRTAIWKKPVTGRIFARRLNLDGDGQGDLRGHGGEQRALMVYQLESYRYWANYLGRSDLVNGIFGENLTVEGLADTEVCIGDRFRIGSAILEVSQPRDTCYRLGIRLENPQMPALLVSHHRPGFYFRVIQEGDLGAGDRIEKLSDGPERMTVAEIDALLYSAEHPLEGLAPRRPHSGAQPRVASLNAEAGRRCGSRRHDGQRRPWARRVGSPRLAWLPPAYHRGFARGECRRPIVRIRRRRRLAAAIGLSGPIYLGPRATEPGRSRSHAELFAVRSTRGANYRIGVKNEHGLASGFLHQSVRAGSLVEVSAPRGLFTLADGATPVVLISAGVGVTPMLAMLHAAAATSAPRPIWWLHSARDRAHHAFAKEADDLLVALPASRRCVVYSRPAPEDLLGPDFDRPGHLSPQLLEELGVPHDADFYLCGPPRFLEDFQQGLVASGIAHSRIHWKCLGPVRSHAWHRRSRGSLAASS